MKKGKDCLLIEIDKYRMVFFQEFYYVLVHFDPHEFYLQVPEDQQ